MFVYQCKVFIGIPYKPLVLQMHLLHRNFKFPLYYHQVKKTCLIEKFPLAIFGEYAWPFDLWRRVGDDDYLHTFCGCSCPWLSTAIYFPLDPRILPAETNALFTFLFFNSFLHQNPWSCCFHCLESHCQWCLVSFLLLHNVFTDHPVSGITPGKNVIAFSRVLINSLS